MPDPSDHSNTLPEDGRDPPAISSNSSYERDAPESFEDDPAAPHRHDAELYRDDEPSQNWDLSHLMFAAVPAVVELAGVAKAAAAFSHRDDRPTGAFPAHETFEMVSEFDADAAEMLEQKWGALTPIERLDSDAGQRWTCVLEESTDWNESDSTDGNNRLYNEFGDSIPTREELDELTAGRDTPIWLVPALALEPGEDSRPVGRTTFRGPNRALLQCRSCDEETEHSFDSYEEVPMEEHSGQPIWECRQCGGNRYGPNPGQSRE